jgi:hypothetical protein
MDKKTKIYAIITTLIFFLIYFGIKHFQESSKEKSIIGKWESEKMNKENYNFKFNTDNTVEINNNTTTLRMNYNLDNKSLMLIDSEKVVKTYSYNIKNEILSLSEKGDTLNFQRVE